MYTSTASLFTDVDGGCRGLVQSLKVYGVYGVCLAERLGRALGKSFPRFRRFLPAGNQDLQF